jgi:peptidoglycan/LPS O-acetylase OafA/YrhL
VEAFFYFVFPFVILRLRPSSARKAVLAAGFFWLLAMMFPLFCVLHWPQRAWAEQPSLFGAGSVFIYNVRRLPVMFVPEFLAGISLGWLYVRFRPSARIASVLATLGAASTIIALMLANHLPFVMLHNGLLLPLFAALLIGLCEPNWLSRLLSAPWLMLLGEASFAIYLFHFIFNDQHWFGLDSTFRTAGLTLAVIIPFSILIHLYFERPCRRIILKWWRDRHPEELAMVARTN